MSGIRERAEEALAAVPTSTWAECAAMDLLYNPGLAVCGCGHAMPLHVGDEGCTHGWGGDDPCFCSVAGAGVTR